MEPPTRTYLKELVVPILPCVTELYAFRGKRAILDGFVYSLSTLAGGKEKEIIETPLHKMWTAFSGVSAGALVGLETLLFCDITQRFILEGKYEDAFFSGALLVAGRGVVGTGARAVEHYMQTRIGK